VRKGDLLTTVTTSDEAIRIALAFLQHYRESAEYLERTYTYLERGGIEAVRRARLRARARRPARGGRPMTAVADPTWTLVGRLEDIPHLEGRSVTVQGRRIAIFRLPTGLAAVDA